MEQGMQYVPLLQEFIMVGKDLQRQLSDLLSGTETSKEHSSWLQPN